ncbi:MAG: S9 family peptidase [Sphingobacteriales bacterium]|nr:MAG: S9 family peptidase [Sphingobacteriales bacterium]
MRIIFNNKTYLVFAVFFLVNSVGLLAQQTIGYQTPPALIAEIIDSATTQNVKISNGGKYLVIAEKPTYLSISAISQPEFRLGGLRINPKNNALSRAQTFTSIKVKAVDSTEAQNFIGLPNNPEIGDIEFSPNDSLISFTNTTSLGVELWVASLTSLKAKKLSNFYLNNTCGKVYQWLADSESILAKFLVDKRLPQPVKDNTLIGPFVQQNLGYLTPTKTYQDLLKNEYDETLLEYFLTAQLKTVFLTGEVVNFSVPAVYKDFEFSPDGEFTLLKTINKPYSYLVPVNGFSYTVQLTDNDGTLIKKLATIPSTDNLPLGFDAVVTGQREFGWRNDKPSTYFWVEAQDDGNPSKKSIFRDMIFTYDMVSGVSKKLTSCYYRFNKIDWADDNMAIVTEKWHKTHSERRVYIKPNNSLYRVNLWDRYFENGYDNPGDFIKIKNQYHKDVLLTQYKNSVDKTNLSIFTICEGASASGNRPFILKFNVKTKLTDTLLRSNAPYYEKPIFFNNKNFGIFTRESVKENPNYFYTDLPKSKLQQLTFFAHPYPQFKDIQKIALNYKRKDSLKLSATLYLPPNYSNKDGVLPVLIWACPQEFKTGNAAAQIKTSPYQFSKIDCQSPLLWLTQGYAVLDNVEMPIVGESNEQPNNTFVKQLTQNAQAAVNTLVKMGIADAERIAIGGHSYGAFMVANLLAHTKLFASGIALSGAYNRTLTPFGFDNEERTYWQAPLVYNAMSPFNFANKIKAPLLLIHGDADENAGTYTMQSERFYKALKGNGATTRLVILPNEAHIYTSKESILHSLWEIDNWLNLYVKNKTKLTEK